MKQQFKNKDKIKKLFETTRAERIHCWQTCTIKNTKGSSSDRWKIIPDGSVDLQKKKGNRNSKYQGFFFFLRR